MGLRGLYKVAATTAASWDLLLKALIQVTVDCDRFCPNTVRKSLRAVPVIIHWESSPFVSSVRNSLHITYQQWYWTNPGQCNMVQNWCKRMFDQWSTTRARRTCSWSRCWLARAVGTFNQGEVWPMVSKADAGSWLAWELCKGRTDQWSTEADAGHTPSMEGAHVEHARRSEFFDHSPLVSLDIVCQAGCRQSLAFVQQQDQGF